MNQIEQLQAEIANDQAKIRTAEVNLSIDRKMLKLKQTQIQLLTSLQTQNHTNNGTA